MVGGGTSYELRLRLLGNSELRTTDGHLVGTFPTRSGKFRDADRHIIARLGKKISALNITDLNGQIVATIYDAANQPPNVSSGDHTVVINAPRPLPRTLGLLILASAIEDGPYFEPQRSSGGA
jgi:hypothetical protein